MYFSLLQLDLKIWSFFGETLLFKTLRLLTGLRNQKYFKLYKMLPNPLILLVCLFILKAWEGNWRLLEEWRASWEAWEGIEQHVEAKTSPQQTASKQGPQSDSRKELNSTHNLQKPASGFFSRASRQETSPTDTLISALGKP